MDDDSPRGLHEVIAAASRDLQAQTDPQATMDTAVDIAVRTIAGADAAALSIVEKRKRVDTPAATDRAARYSDELQYELGEGPCLDAIWEHHVIDTTDLDNEPRWPRWAPRVVWEAGFRSMVCFRLFLSEHTVGALNLYSRTVDGFDTPDREAGIAIAAHIAVAVRAAQQVDQLQSALDSRTTIGQATGILMERSDLDAFQAFMVLTNVASSLERKVADLAEEFVATRRLPATRRGSGRPAQG
jgi:transcriptional regulator with GAF, ATPase, and Fis domain